MKVKISYIMRVERVVEMTPEKYCYLRADHADPRYFPPEARETEMRPYSEKDESELTDYFFRER